MTHRAALLIRYLNIIRIRSDGKLEHEDKSRVTFFILMRKLTDPTEMRSPFLLYLEKPPLFYMVVSSQIPGSASLPS
jgi:hypothetical protein